MLQALWLALGFLQEAGEGTGTEGEPPAGALNPDTAPPDRSVPYERFREVNDRLKALMDRVTAYEDKDRQAEEQRLTDQKKWEELANKATAERNDLLAKIAEWERKEQFQTVALAANIPADRILDAYRLTEFGEGEPDYPALVAALVKTRPWLTGEPATPTLNAESGKGHGGTGTPEQLKRQRSVQEGARFLPRDMTLPAQKG